MNMQKPIKTVGYILLLMIYRLERLLRHCIIVLKVQVLNKVIEMGLTEYGIFLKILLLMRKVGK